MNETQVRRGRGRPRKANALTAVQRSQRYRDKQRTDLSQAVDSIMDLLIIEASKPCDRNEVQCWQNKLTEQFNRNEKEFYEALRRFDNDYRNKI